MAGQGVHCFEADVPDEEPVFLINMLNLIEKIYWPTFCYSVLSKKTLNAKGVKMKKVIIGIAMAVCFNMGFAICGAGNYTTTGSMPAIAFEKAFAADSAPNTLTLHKQPAPEASIFSWTMVLYLSVAVIIIISIRRNTYV